eukprot:TRINITY_DN17614_c0_g2_i1.p1 TRINITY_DN17614_c0_g2~~TRINITY_DN17614_c0_g2_i1.p1  ORF type:complete len:307 (-),score=18.03 TRINITY_DN17614_c0_g2_i1:144-1064(-)
MCIRVLRFKVQCVGRQKRQRQVIMDHKKVEMYVVKLRKKYPLVDVGINLTSSLYDKDRYDVILRAQQAGLEALIINGTNLNNSQMASKLCEDQEEVPLYFTAGVHPQFAHQYNDQTTDNLRDLALSSPYCVGIGECGLSLSKGQNPLSVQLKCFEEQVNLAVSLKKPLLFTCKYAHKDLIKVLDRIRPNIPIIVDCFMGSMEQLEDYLKRGFFIGINAWVCDDRRPNVQQMYDVIKAIPNNRLMLETDAPFVPPRNVGSYNSRPQRNEPGLLPAILEQVSKIRGQEQIELAQISTTNAQMVFQLQI